MVSRFEQFSASIAAIYKYIQRIERDEMAKYGLKGPHVQCLTALERHPDGLTAAALCEICGKDKAAISRAISELERSGLVCRKGAYRAALRLTDSGREIAAVLGRTVDQAVELAGQGLSDQDRQVFYRVLDRIAANIQYMSEMGISEPDARK